MGKSISLLVITYPLWCWTLGLLVALGWAMRRDLPSAATPAGPGNAPSPTRSVGAMAVWIGVVALVGALVAFTLWRPDFAARDSFVFTTYTLVGEDFPPPVWPPDGRFWPLGLQEFNLIRHLTSSAVGYHLLPAAQLLIVLALVHRLTRGMPALARATIPALLLVNPGVAIAFTGLVFPERSIVFFVLVLLVLLQRWDRAPSTAVLAGILTSAHFALYYKENVFLLVAGIGAVRLLLRSTGRRNVLTIKGREAEWGLLALSALWAAFFLAFKVRAAGPSYAERYDRPLLEVLGSYAAVDPLLFVFLAVVAWRVIGIAARRIDADRFWDPVAIGGAVFALTYLALKLYRPYYMAPVDVIAVLYLGRLALQRIGDAAPARRLAIAGAAALLFAVSARTSVVSLAEQRGTVASKVALAEWLALRVPESQGAGLNLFLPYTNSFDLMELAAFLRYKGLPVELATEPMSASAVRLLAPMPLPGGRCAPWWRLRCYEASAPPPGALVVVLPEDSVPAGHLAASTVGFTQVLLAEPPGWVAALADGRRVQVFRAP